MEIRPTLSVVTVCDKPISKEFYLLELLNSVIAIADEIIIINAGEQSSNTELSQIVNEFKNKHNNAPIKIVSIPWQERGEKNTYWMWKSVGIYQASCDYVLRLDADEVLLDTKENHAKIIKAMRLGNNCYTFRVTHFWKDYMHILSGKNSVDNNNLVYTRRNYLFKNGLGYYENLYDICDVDGNNISSTHTSIEVFHYGGVRKSEIYLNKKNQIEKAYHKEWQDLKKWNWETSADVLTYNGIHPSAMEKRIRSFNE